MATSGDADKFGSLILPNCQRTALQEEMLQSCPFARESKVLSGNIPSSSYTEEQSEQETGIAMFSLPESSDEYHTPPDHPSCSQNSNNEGQVPPTKISAFEQDIESVRIVDLTNETDDLPENSPRVLEDNNTHTIDKNDTDQMDVDDQVDKIDPERTSTHQVFVEMPQRAQETSNREKRKLPISVKTRNQNSNYSKYEPFTTSLNRVLKMVGEGKSRGGGEEEDEQDIDFLETAKMRGLTFPRPRWWPAEGFKD